MIQLYLKDLQIIFGIVSKTKKEFPELLDQGFGWTELSLKESLQASLAVGIKKSEELAAFIIYRDLGEVLEIDLLCTDPKWRGQGVMRALLSDFCKNNPSKSLWLEVHENNLNALNFYRKMGFKETGRRKGYYADGKSAILMTFNQ